MHIYQYVTFGVTKAEACLFGKYAKPSYFLPFSPNASLCELWKFSVQRFNSKGILSNQSIQQRGSMLFFTYVTGTVVSLHPTDAQKPFGSDALSMASDR